MEQIIEYNTEVTNYWRSVIEKINHIDKLDLHTLRRTIEKGVDEYCKLHGMSKKKKEKRVKQISNLRRYLGNVRVKCPKCKIGLVPNSHHSIVSVESGYFDNNNFFGTCATINTRGNRIRDYVKFRCIFCGGVEYTFK